MIKEVEKGGTPTMMHTELANQVIGVCNAFSGLRVSPESAGALVINGDSAVLRLNQATATADVFTGFSLLNASTEVGFAIRVRISSLCDLAPDGFSPGDTPNFVLSPITVSGYVYGIVTITSGGAITGREITFGATIPDNTATEFHVEIGSYAVAGDPETLTITNTRYGPISAQFCYNRAVEPPVWSAMFF